MMHTPGRWINHRDVDGTEVILAVDANDDPITCIGHIFTDWDQRIWGTPSPGRNEGIANAEFVVRACNAYYGLLEAMRELIVHAENSKEVDPMRDKAIDHARALMKQSGPPK
jgi:hypothetical protein